MIDRNHLGLALLVVGILPLAAAACTPGSPAGAAPLSKEDKIARGEYLVTVGACNDCHTPFKMGPNGPEPDASRRLSGHPAGLEMPPPPAPTGPWLVSVGATNTAWSGPWGGSWTPQIFVDTIRNGRHMGRGRPLLPPMPFPFYAKMTDEDLTAIFAYLRTLPAIDNRVPSPIPPVAR
jgi:mono/diheme cytochrome c family protein